ncbi:MAG: conjugal transfer protein TrbF [Bacteroidota bacterium]
MNTVPTVTEAGDNPYLNARREWNERYGDYIAAARAWRLACFGSLAIALVAVGGTVYMASQVRIVPYVVEVNRLGQAVAIGPADKAAPADARVVTAQLARLVFNLRTVYADVAAERALINEAYAGIDRDGPARAATNEYFKANDPFVRARTETVRAQIESVLPISANVWRVEWEETITARNGTTVSKASWQADITLMVKPPSDAEAILLNPMGVYVTEYSWTKRVRGTP